MGFLGFGKREVIDLTERYKREQGKILEKKTEKVDNSKNFTSSSQGSGMFGVFNLTGQSNQVKSEDSPQDVEEKKKKLAKRLMDMTDKIEDLSNQIYHLQHRIEVLEQKLRIGVGG